jgi:hypothetical protein
MNARVTQNGCSVGRDVVNLGALLYKAFSDFIVPSFPVCNGKIRDPRK